MKFVRAHTNRISLRGDGGHGGAQGVLPLPPLLLSPKVRLRQVLRVKEQVDNISFQCQRLQWWAMCLVRQVWDEPRLQESK